MKAQAYLDMMKRQQQELTDFPIAYAFNFVDKMFDEYYWKGKSKNS